MQSNLPKFHSHIRAAGMAFVSVHLGGCAYHLTKEGAACLIAILIRYAPDGTYSASSHCVSCYGVKSNDVAALFHEMASWFREHQDNPDMCQKNQGNKGIWRSTKARWDVIRRAKELVYNLAVC